MADWMTEAREAARAELDAEMRRIKEQELACGWCKRAKVRKGSERATCRRHGEAYHLAYVTSPVSEAYWSS